MMAIAVAAMSFASCSTDVTEDIAPVEKFTVKINAVSPESRTVFGDINEGKYPTLWTGNESIKAELNLTSAYNNPAIPITSVSADKTSATFEATFKATDADEYTIYAVCPADAYVSGPNSKYNFNLLIPTEQTPTATSCDPKAQILVGQSATTTTRPTSVDMQFKHMTAYAKISFINTNLSNDVTISSIDISSESHIAGKYNYYVAEHADGFPAGTINPNTPAQSITVNTSSLKDVWVALAPVDVSDTDMTFVITTSKGFLTKTIHFGDDKSFKSGVITTFNVDMSGIELESADKYTLVTDLSVLAEGDNVIIASAGSDYAISTDNSGSHRSATGITKSDNTITPNSLVGIFTVHDAGTNLYAFKDASNDNAYLYASTSSSYYDLGTQAENDANGHWDITLDSTTGEAIVVAQGTNTNNVIHCITSSGGNVYFGATPSTYTKGYFVSLYYKSNGGAKIAIEPQIKASDISNVAAEGVQNATANIEVRGIASVTATPDGTVVTAASVSGNVLTYTVAANTSSSSRTGTITLEYNSVSVTINVIQLSGNANDGSSVEKAYTVAEAIALHNAGTAPADAVWVVGPIAGYYKSGTGLVSDLTSAVDTNLAIGTAGECIPVELPKGTTRTALNIKENPSNLGKVVYLKGKITTYFSVAGLKGTSEYQFAE